MKVSATIVRCFLILLRERFHAGQDRAQLLQGPAPSGQPAGGGIKCQPSACLKDLPLNEAREMAQTSMRMQTRAAWAVAVVLASAMISVASAQAQSLTFDLIHTFTGPPDGLSPAGGLAGYVGAAPFLDAKGNLFGTTSWGG